jgi:hypothetical protein
VKKSPMPTATKQRKPRHMMGKSCGYTLYPDGSVLPAPSHYEALDKSLIEEQAVSALLTAVTKQCHVILMPIIESRRRVWVSMKEDYGLDFDNFAWSYNLDTHVLTKAPKIPKEPSRGEEK